MRVISGKNRGLKLLAPEGLTTRPTTDRIKETLFSMIQFDIPGCVFLDVFSGSGAIGIEALSRGAKSATFIENNINAYKCILQNVEKANMQQEAIIYNKDVQEAIQLIANQNKQYDIIFLDPPYALESIGKIIQNIIDKQLLSDNGYIILEHGTDYVVGDLNGVRCFKEKQYKTTTLRFFERNSDT
ncbi:MAG: 16S rRNA (guanine(966)-N(2))-methyltransferase RsmD [Cellulosilyticaceae bacterium]